MLLFALLFLLPLTQAYLYKPKYVPLNICSIDRRSLLNSHEEQLYDMLMCNYDIMVPPKAKNSSETIEVDFQFLLWRLIMAEQQDVLSLSVWSRISWKDERLKWDSEYYDNIGEIYINIQRLWLPTVKLYNSIEEHFDRVINGRTVCKIVESGDVACTSKILFQVICTGNVRNWPFDTRVCSLEFGPPPDQMNMYRLDFQNSLAMIKEPNGADWKIVKYEQEENQIVNKQLTMRFTLERQSEAIAAMVVYPIILISILNFSSSFLDVSSSVRLTVVCFSLLCNFYALRQWGEDIPKHSKDTPKVLLCYRFAVVLNVTSLLMVYVLKLICQSKKETPSFISTINDYVYKSYEKFVFPRWESGRDSAAWYDFASLLNCVYIILLFFNYVIMFCVCIPLPTSFNDDDSNSIIIPI